MQLEKINQVTGQIKLLSGLHIGSGSDEIHIGGIDNPIIKHPYTLHPYIPGSSLKGKMRSLLEWRAGIVAESKGKPVSIKTLEMLTGAKAESAHSIIQLFGAAGDSSNAERAEEIGPTRLSFWDAPLDSHWAKKVDENNWLYTEAKSENTINRISGTAENPRQTERVPAETKFEFKLSLKILKPEDEKLLELLLNGLKLLEMDGIGGSGSRGYGKITFINMQLNGEDLQTRLNNIDPFA